MDLITYDDTAIDVRADLAECHRRRWDALSNAGTWLTGEERVAVMAESRNARGCVLCEEQNAALSPYTVTGVHDAFAELPANWIEVIHHVVCDPGRLTHSWYKNILEGGIEDVTYVEIISVIAQTTAIDTFARGLGVAPRPLPTPQVGEPTRYRPKEAHQQKAWVPNIANGEEGPNEADQVGMASNIRRALTLVPDEARGFWSIADVQYLSAAQMQDVGGSYRAISRMQIELLASRVSALNQCTY